MSKRQFFAPSLNLSLFENPLNPPFTMPKYAEMVYRTIESGKPVLLVGPNGSGKTRLYKELAAQCQRKLRRVNLDGSLTPEAFLGAPRVRSKIGESGAVQTETFFQPGPVTLAMEQGDWLVLDEVDKALPEYLCALHPITEDIKNPLVLLDDGAREVFAHPNFRIMATSNTLGQAEDFSSGYSPGASQINQAFLDRFSILRVDFPEHEDQIINTVLQNDELSLSLTRVARLTREASSKGELTHFDFSTRRLIALATSFVSLSSLKDAMELELLSRLPSETRSLVESFISNVFGSGWKSISKRRTEESDTASEAAQPADLFNTETPEAFEAPVASETPTPSPTRRKRKARKNESSDDPAEEPSDDE
jgi:cobaltochelatase CobS